RVPVFQQLHQQQDGFGVRPVLDLQHVPPYHVLREKQGMAASGTISQLFLQFLCNGGFSAAGISSEYDQLFHWSFLPVSRQPGVISCMEMKTFFLILTWTVTDFNLC